MLTLRVDETTKKRLERLARHIGRTEMSLACAAIEAQLDDLEDFYLAEQRMRGFGQRDAIPLEQMKIGAR